MERRRTRLGAWGAAAWALFLAQPTAAAQEVPVPARHRVTYDAALAGRVNPLGLFLVGNVSAKERLFRHDSIILRDNYVGLGVGTALSPAFGRVGLHAELQPLTILRLTVNYLYGGYFGTFGNLQSFVSPDADWSDQALRDLDDASDPSLHGYVTGGHNLRLEARLQLKVSGLAIRSTFSAFFSRYDLRAGDTVYYEPILDVPAENGGWVLSNDLDAFWLFEGTGWLAGARYNWTAPLYSEDAWANDPDGMRTHDNVMHRLGPVLGYIFDARSEAFDQSTLVLVLNWYAVHRNRTGEDVPRAVPYIGLAYLTRGTLFARDDAPREPSAVD